MLLTENYILKLKFQTMKKVAICFLEKSLKKIHLGNEKNKKISN